MISKKPMTAAPAPVRKGLAILGLAAAAAILGTVPAAADDHPADARPAAVQAVVAHGLDDHANGGGDDHPALAGPRHAPGDDHAHLPGARPATGDDHPADMTLRLA
ncbi:hypothetical protein GCM10010218_44350 [Streptomyces mashuensis]|uniref:Secreted protein n=1 Tax=Streptomyces mashuensis TaxID=33904 RepID=A0A919B531_9ACTN|nr:hypothetical protein [Streptomyces mashuensis]GHF58054.1 hypothetical protein GCM10010218_44350 [Streptomyces mashuensis]